MAGYNYVPQPGDTIKNGVYQDFANFVQTFPTRWNDVRASRVNDLDIGLRKNFQIIERVKLQLRFDAFNAFNHPRFGRSRHQPERFDVRPSYRAHSRIRLAVSSWGASALVLACRASLIAGAAPASTRPAAWYRDSSR